MPADSRIPWARVALEGAVIVASILLAFALDAWWDERKERGRVGEMLDAVAAEFEAQRAAMDSVVAENERVIAWYLTVFPRTDPDLPSLSQDSIRMVGGEIEDYQIWEAGFGALAALVNGALLEKVPDAELRRSLGGWDGELEDLEWSRQQVYDANQRSAGLLVSTGQAPHLLDDRTPFITRLRAIATDEEMRAAETIFVDALYSYNQDLYRIRQRASEIVAGIRAMSGPEG
ncbi:MAG: hypothetical protein JSU98_15535 [Gemmatimonadales bacterium]|nr:MAG: hypothetical protein JSU98_15535 [Gemmatimonadales bacterium]